MASWPPFDDPLDLYWNWSRRMQVEGSLDLFFFSHASDATRAAWTILTRDTVVGLLQLKHIRRAEGEAELGIAFGAPWVGQGYGREALSAFLRLFFGPAGFGTMRLEVAPTNIRALRLYRRLGFVETSRFWRYAGPAHEFDFLDLPEYAAMRPCFRYTGAGVYQVFAEMRLDAAAFAAIEASRSHEGA
jgi:RimJ/RimL family protein N-acetyltransferase